MWILYELFSVESFERIRNLESDFKFSTSNFNAKVIFYSRLLEMSKELNVILPTFRKHM